MLFQREHLTTWRSFPTTLLFVNASDFTIPQSRRTAAPCLSPQNSLCFRGLPEEPSVVGTGTRSPPLPSIPGISSLWIQLSITQPKLEAMTTATLGGVIKRNLIILIKNSQQWILSQALAAGSNSRGMPLWGVVEPRSWIEAHHRHVARSYLAVTSIQYQRSARIFF